MRRPTSTVLVVTGPGAPEIIRQLGALHNVRALQGGSDDDVRQATATAGTTYVVHDRDPLSEVGEAWVGFFDRSAPAGRLEVAIESAVSALRAESVALPDYYIVLDPQDLPDTWRHWWLGVLTAAAPSRVLPSPGHLTAVRDLLAGLPAGRMWPDPTRWLRELPRSVPDVLDPLAR